MKKIISLILSICITAGMSAAVFADEIEFNNVDVYPVDSMARLKTFSLSDNENTVELKCSAISNPYEEYYISLYEKGSIDDAHYVFKFIGPVQIRDFSIEGLTGGKSYYIGISSTRNKQVISGTITTSYTEEK